jgi:hypothetical protein
VLPFGILSCSQPEIPTTVRLHSFAVVGFTRNAASEADAIGPLLTEAADEVAIIADRSRFASLTVSISLRESVCCV